MVYKKKKTDTKETLFVISGRKKRNDKSMYVFVYEVRKQRELKKRDIIS